MRAVFIKDLPDCWFVQYAHRKKGTRYSPAQFSKGGPYKTRAQVEAWIRSKPHLRLVQRLETE